jgi:hypothetical protein
MPKNVFYDLARETYDDLRNHKRRFSLEDVQDAIFRAIQREKLTEAALYELSFRLARAADSEPTKRIQWTKDQTVLWTDEELGLVIRLGEGQRVVKRDMTAAEANLHLDILRDKAKRIDGTADREEEKIQKLMPWMQNGMSYGEAVDAYLALQATVRP